MKFSVSKKVFDRFPNARFGALLITGVDNKKDVPELEKRLKEMVKNNAEKFQSEDLKTITQIKSWREVFTTLGLNRDFLPSHEALLRRVVSKKELPSINPLVNIYNIISLTHLIPIGGHDTKKAPVIRIDETTGKETFQTMNSDEVTPVEEGELAYICKDKVLTRHFVWRQSETSKTDEGTTDIFIPIDNAAGDMTEEQIEQIAKELKDLITTFLGGTATFGIVDKCNPEIELEDSYNASKQQNAGSAPERWQKYMSMVDLKEPKMDVVTDEARIEDVLSRGVKDIFPKKEELKKMLLSGKRLRLYTGIDPTANFIHVGHFIWMKKLSQFQKLGHQVIFMIGAFTAMIGDPDKEYTRQPLTKEQVWENFKSYQNIAAKIIDFEWEENPVTILNNYDWLSTVTLEDWLQIMGSVTLQHILSHDMFENRLKEEKPIRLHETMYPLMQGFDCVVMNVDLEVGGSDQTFNMLTGRILSRELLNKDKFVLTLKLLTDPSGAKMGKTTGNAIASTDTPEDMYGKIMSWPDENILQGYEQLTDVNLDGINSRIEKDPMNMKKQLAFEIVKMLSGLDGANKAQEHFEKTVQGDEVPDEMEEVTITGSFNNLDLVKKLVELGFISSNAEAKRLLKQGAIHIDGNELSIAGTTTIKSGNILKVGKRQYIKVK